MLEKVISGFQSGADIAGVIAAKNCGLQTGGYMPKGFKTENGNKPEYKELYGAIEINSFDYPKRTLANVNAADATWVFYRGKLEKGSALTIKYCERLRKLGLAINLTTLNKEAFIEDYSNWLELKEIEVLNIAGNRESVAPGIQQEVTELLTKVFKNVKLT